MTTVLSDQIPAAPFELRGRGGSAQARTGILCVHGFTGTPFEVRWFGEELHRRAGYEVLGIRLAGHGTDVDALEDTRWRDWFASVETGFDELASRCDRVVIAGISLGSLLGLELARRRGRKVAALIAMATPLWLPPVTTAAIRAASAPLWQRLLGRRRLKAVPKLGGGSDIRDVEMKAKNPALPRMPILPLASLLDLAALVRLGLEDVVSPVLVAHGKRDHTAPPACADELYKRLSARTRWQPDARTDQLMLEESFHVITIDLERDILVDRTLSFLEDVLGTAPVKEAA